MKHYVMDCEVLSNHTLFGFYDGVKHFAFDETQYRELREFISKDLVLIGYNISYDEIILKTILRNKLCTSEDLYKVSKRIINSEGRMPDDLFKVEYSPREWAFSICMYNILGKKGSLKLHECHEHMQTVAEGHVDWDAPLPDDARPAMRKYNKNDIEATWLLYKKYEHLIELRREIQALYGVSDRVFVLNGVGVAKLIYMDQYKQRTGGFSSTARAGAQGSTENKVREWPTKDIVCSRVSFQTPEFQAFFADFLNQTLVGDEKGTTWGYKDGKYKEPVKLGNKSYQIGCGGLHSIDEPGRFYANLDVGIWESDVQSYYPSQIIEQNLFPSHLGPEWVDEFEKMRDMRIAAKKAGNKKTADALKLILNSSFGSLNEAYSPIRSIPSALRVTINGQLQLLMLIERFEMRGVRILSANTDSVTVMWHKALEAQLDIDSVLWQKDTGHVLERVEYSTYCRRDVNTLCAKYTDGKIKIKGGLEQAPNGGNRDERCVKLAAVEYLLNGTPIKDTIESCKSITDFVYYIKVGSGGKGYYGDEEIGTLLRWYVAKKGTQIRRRNPEGAFANIPNGGNAKLILDLPASFPEDLDKAWYIEQAVKLVNSITARAEPKKPRAKKATNV